MSYVKFMGGVLIISFWPPSYRAKPGSVAISQDEHGCRGDCRGDVGGTVPMTCLFSPYLLIFHRTQSVSLQRVPPNCPPEILRSGLEISLFAECVLSSKQIFYVSSPDPIVFLRKWITYVWFCRIYAQRYL